MKSLANAGGLKKHAYVKEDHLVYKRHRICRIRRMLRSRYGRNYRQVVVGRRGPKRACGAVGTAAR